MTSTLDDNYFDYLYSLMCGGRYPEEISYRKLFRRLHEVRFRYTIPRDRNRAKDGENLRKKYISETLGSRHGSSILLSGRCTVLEMMVALAIRCEESIMDDPAKGDRTRQWFWGMITSMGLGGMTDDRYDENYVKKVLKRFLDRDYAPNGKGGLFTIKKCDTDLRDVEIWYQLCWYLNGIT